MTKVGGVFGAARGAAWRRWTWRGGVALFAAVRLYAEATLAKGIELTVEHANVPGWRFWEKQGFALDTEFRTYFLKLPTAY